MLQQLGWVEDALVAGRFFREELAADPGKLGVQRASAVLLLRGAVPGPNGGLVMIRSSVKTGEGTRGAR